MKAIIPVAGYGTRLEPHTVNLQKCLLPVAGKPVLAHIFDKLSSANILEITLIVGHLSSQVIEFCKSYKNISFNFVHQAERLGLGHAIYQALVKNSDPILILLGDGIFELDYNKLIQSHCSQIGVNLVPDPERFGIVETDGVKISKFHEKPKNPSSNLAISGIYFIKSQIELYNALEYLIVNNLRSHNEFQLTDSLQYMLSNHYRFEAFKIDKCLDCGIPDTILSTNKYLLELKGENKVDISSKIINSELINCTISKNCYIENSKLNNVIMLSDKSLINQELKNCII
jgi:glucose-1-phosphate thymidylyltransferase